MNGSNLIKEIGRSYLVSSFIPASLFAFIFNLIFQDFFPEKFVERLEGNNSSIDGSIALSVLFVIWLAFALYSSQDRITKFFEGYYFPTPLKTIFTWVELLRVWRLEKHWHEYLRLKEESGNPATFTPPEELRSKLISEFQERELRAPLDKANLLPTRLGNVLRASEDYSYHKYGIDGITIWPRLKNFLPIDLKEDLREYNNHMAFLINSSLLTLALALICFTVYIVEKYCGSVALLHDICSSQIWQNGFTNLTTNFYLVSSVVFLVCGFALYSLGVAAAEGQGLYVRTAYDLYRYRLLEHINEKSHKNLKDSEITWDRLGDFYILGDSLGPIDFQEPKTRPRWELLYPSIFVIWSFMAGLLIKIIAHRYNRDRAATC